MKEETRPIRTIQSLKLKQMLAQPRWELPDRLKNEEWKKRPRKELFEAILYLHEKLDQTYMMLNTRKFSKKDILYSVQQHLKRFESFGENIYNQD